MYPSSFIFVAITSLVTFVVATPPSCLLAAVLEQPNPADLKSLCGSLEPQMASNITASCSGSNLASAVAAYSSTCLAKGFTVSITTSAPSSSQTGSSTATTTNPGSVSTSTAASVSGSGGASGSTSTGTAATTSATGKSGAASVSASSAGIWISVLVACGIASQYVL